MDLLNKLNKGGSKESAEDKASDTSVKTNVPPISTSKAGLAGDILSQSKGTGTTGGKIDSKEDKQSETASETKETKAKEDVSTDSKVEVGDPESWTKESAFKEVKKLREENKTYRLKYEEKLSGLKTEMEQRLNAKEQEFEALKKAQEELEEIKARQADAKRDLAEKVAHREAVAAELKAKLEAQKSEYEKQLSVMKNERDRYYADIAAQQEVYKQRLAQEVSSIPEKYKGVAELIIKGAGDEREAFVAISEAKLNGVFEDKTVVVNHSVPGAKDGARSTNERMEEAKRTERNKMTSGQKIGAALKDIRSGNSNPAFRSNR